MTLAQQEHKESGFQRAVKKFSTEFEKLGLTASDIPPAIIVHEVLGLAMAIGWWSACYVTTPSRRMATAFQGISQGRRGAALQRASATVQKMSWLQKMPVDPARLTVSLAESIMLRAAIKPVTFGFKIWATYKLIMLGKQLQQQRQERASTQAGRKQAAARKQKPA